MTGMVPFAGLQITGATTPQTIGASAAQLALPGATATISTYTGGDPAVRSDPANYRFVCNTPGIYRLDVDLTLSGNASLQTTLQVRKSGTAVTGQKSVNLIANGQPTQIQGTFLIQVTTADIPTSGGCQTFSNPDASAGAGKPAGGFAGAGAAPATGVLVDFAVSGNATGNITPSEGRVLCTRIG